MIKCKSGATISAVVVRSRSDKAPQPAILEFTIYTGAIMALGKDAAAHHYAGIIAFTRGKRYSPDEIVPYEHDGEDANEVIDWISKQSWSNGKVGMYGGSYTGFTQWAATKHLHPALKTIVPAASVAPGLDVPMMNNVFESFVFNWIYYVTNNKYLDVADYSNTAKWDTLFATWYRNGLPYHSLDSLTGRGKNKVFQSWIAHPSYDEYWQNMIPYQKEFGKINIPVLSISGYYDGAQVGAMYYFREHYKYKRNANHYLILGPFTHYGAQGFLGAMPDSVVAGYRMDAVANIPVHDIIFQWFDFIFKNGKRPSILENKVNYEVMGKNEWKHKPSLNSIANDTIQFYLSNERNGKYLRLQREKTANNVWISQTLDYTDRKTINNYNPVVMNVSDSVDLSNGIAFLSEPFDKKIEFSGNFLGTLQFTVNKKDFDYSLNVYEMMPNGKYFYLTYFMGRASYWNDGTKRTLLSPGDPQQVSFTNSYFTSRQLSKGSRLLVVLNINKSQNEQINYGTGKDVSDESMEDANGSLQIKWLGQSRISFPVWRE
jgi:putative CocE/NonD family hydrolase